MPSPHEFATLILLRDAPDQIEANRAELDTLLERQLVALEQAERGTRRHRISENGQSVLVGSCSVKYALEDEVTNVMANRHVATLS